MPHFLYANLCNKYIDKTESRNVHKLRLNCKTFLSNNCLNAALPEQEGLYKLTFRSPFWLQPFCESAILWYLLSIFLIKASLTLQAWAHIVPISSKRDLFVTDPLSENGSPLFRFLLKLNSLSLVIFLWK